jgi:hypothetical protein
MAYLKLDDFSNLNGPNRPVLNPLPSLSSAARHIPASVVTIPEGFKGTEATIKEMRRLARLASLDPKFVMFTRSIVAGLPSKAYYDEANRLFEFVRKHVRYVLDPRGMEYVQDPRHVMFVDGQGDCDDQSTMIAAMALSLGHEAAFKTIAVGHSRPNEFSHVYPLIGIQKGLNTEWWAADTTQKNAHLGWEPPKFVISQEKVWSV